MTPNQNQMITAEVTTSENETYRARLDPVTLEVQISRLDRRPDTWVWSGTGRWRDNDDIECGADLGDEAYDLLARALKEAGAPTQ